jgi:hypothetical protein
MRYILIFISALFFNNINAQQAAYGFAKTYTLNANGSGFFRTLIQNDTIIALANTPVPNPPYYPWKISVSKIDTFGNLFSSTLVQDTTNNDYYTKTSSDFISTPDSGYIAVGCINNGLYGNIVKFNRNGQTQWIKKIRNTANNWFNGFFDVVQFSNNRYVCAGIQNSNNDFQNNLWLFFFDESGNKIRDTVYTSMGTRFQHPHSIKAVAPNKILLGAGWSDYQNPWILAIDTLGNVLHEWHAPTNLKLMETYGIQPTPDGGLIFCGSHLDSIIQTDIIKSRGAITKLDSNFQVEWVRYLGQPVGDQKFVNGIITQEGNYIALGQYWQPFVADGSQGQIATWTHKIDLQGNTIWESKDTALFMPSINATLDYAWNIKELSSGSLIICGDATDLLAQPNRSTAFIIKLSKDGCRDTLFCHSSIVATSPPLKGLGSLQVYPNPATRFVTIELPPTLARARVHVYDALGCIVHTAALGNTTELDLRGLPTGLYIVRVYDGAAVVGVQKLQLIQP